MTKSECSKSSRTTAYLLQNQISKQAHSRTGPTVLLCAFCIQSGPVGEEAAKSYVTELLNMARFYSEPVTDIEKIGDGVYKFSLGDGNIPALVGEGL